MQNDMIPTEVKQIIEELLDNDEVFEIVNDIISLFAHNHVIRMIELIDGNKGINSQEVIFLADDQRGIYPADGFRHLQKMRAYNLIVQRHVGKVTYNYLNYLQLKFINNGLELLNRQYWKIGTSSKIIYLREHYKNSKKIGSMTIFAHKGRPFKIHNDDPSFDYDSGNINLNIEVFKKFQETIRILKKVMARKIIKLLLLNESLTVTEIHKRIDDEKRNSNANIEGYHHVEINRPTISAILKELNRIGIITSAKENRNRHKSLVMNTCWLYFEFINAISKNTSLG